MNPVKDWFTRLLSPERRKAARRDASKLVAHYWDGSAPLAHDVRNISSTGFYLLTEHRWYPGTMVMMSLQRTGPKENGAESSIMVKSKVVRAGADGVGLAFVPRKVDARALRSLSDHGADSKTLSRFLKQFETSSGQALIEYVLTLPLLFLLIVNLVNFGGFFFAWITVANAARAGANYAILGGASVGALPQATAAQITSIITQDASSLPNQSSLAVNICQSFNGTVTALSGTCSAVPADPEPTSYVLASIDVTYTYQPFIPAGFQFPNLNIYATIPPTTVHRRAVMRFIQ